jgi:hypothetical protein
MKTHFQLALIPAPAKKITIKYLHLSTHNKRNIFINIGTLRRLAHTYKARIGAFGFDRGLPVEKGFCERYFGCRKQDPNAFSNHQKQHFKPQNRPFSMYKTIYFNGLLWSDPR